MKRRDAETQRKTQNAERMFAKRFCPRIDGIYGIDGKPYGPSSNRGDESVREDKSSRISSLPRLPIKDLPIADAIAEEGPIHLIISPYAYRTNPTRSERPIKRMTNHQPPASEPMQSV